MGSLTDRINEAMKAAGVDIADVARACGISYQAAKKWTTGETRKIEAEHMLKFCDFTSVDIHWMVSGEGERVRLYARTRAQAHTLEVMQSMRPDEEYRVPEIADLLVKHKQNGTL